VQDIHSFLLVEGLPSAYASGFQVVLVGIVLASL